MSLNKEQQQQLLDLAKRAIQHGLLTGKRFPVHLSDYPAALLEHRATFVTLNLHHQLRGCIGKLEAVKSLVEDIADNAFSAAFKDPRFPPLSADEFEHLEIHLSILTPAEPLFFSSEQDLLSQLIPYKDGVILEAGHRRATFLPSVWHSLPKPQQFLRHLKQKAGLNPDFWSDDIKIYRYHTENID